MKKWWMAASISGILMLLLFSGCAQQTPIGEDESGIETVAQLQEFFADGGKTAQLLCSLNLDNTMLTVSAKRGDITLEGNGFSLLGSGDCVIRMDPDSHITLNHIEIIGEKDAIGFLGRAFLTGQQTTITGGQHALHGLDEIVIGKHSDLSLTGEGGNSILCNGLTLDEAARVFCSADHQSINTGDGALLLTEDAALEVTANDYSVLKVGGVLSMMNGSTLQVKNIGEFHGAEIRSLELEGTARIDATGGKKGAGLFIEELYEDIKLLGKCTPAARHEYGKGSIAFYKDEAALQKAIERTADEEKQEE